MDSATTVPASLEEAIAQARTATQAAIQAGLPRMMVELVYSELKGMPVAEQFYPALQELGLTFKIYFPDAGSAALARRDWGNPDFVVRGIGELHSEMTPDDQVYLFVEPSSVEVNQVEEMCAEAGDKFVIMLNPKLEDVATIGIGYAGRQLRDRFLSTLEPIYYLRPRDGAVVLRCYPHPWQVWQETEAGYQLLAEVPQKPSGEALDRILMGETTADPAAPGAAPKGKRGGFLSELQSFLRALTQ
ncbi:MAG: DUF1995 domain-containing protein [Leptolyngbya sp.]|jgi:hypothetical protein|uniref:DUF1995 domain-containing protein n=1 Tax=Shackletoniella antarctica TaxID=268115 RepID=A0A2W4VXW3_9CYAN|nr:MAG: DUF1995 domain-containing protein [Shackletoniella antarctica]PZV08426.1 MAG: DUF1995 domain-containing protein [Leptolyngbya sp.]